MGYRLKQLQASATHCTPDQTKTKRRRKRGRKSLSEIKASQQKTTACCRKAPIDRLLREVVQGYNPKLRMEQQALSALRVAAEAFLIDQFKQAMKVTANRESQTLTVKDMQTARSISSRIDTNS